MPFLVTPGQLARSSEFYHQLGAMQRAGVSLIQALEQLRDAPPSRSFVRPTRRLLDGLNQGLTFAEALRTLGRWLPSFDQALLGAGERSGRLDAACGLLADYYQNRAALARQVISALVYPAVMVHAAILLRPFPQFYLSGNFVRYAQDILGSLLPLYGLAFLVVFALQSRRGEVWRSLLERLLHPIPVLGKARRSLALARLAVALDALVNAGESMTDAWPLAAEASGSPALRREVAGWRRRLQAGESPGDLLASAWPFPTMFRNLYRTGEQSGTLDDTLKRLRAYYEDEAQRKMKALALWVPWAIYAVLILILALSIITFWVNYYNGLLNTEF